jgi:hypothetical protein
MIDAYDAGLISVAATMVLVLCGVRIGYASGVIGLVGLWALRGWESVSGLAAALAYSEVSH